MTVHRAVEVLHDRGPQVTPRWQAGSGFLLAPGLVFTAAHNVSRAGVLSVRYQDRREQPARLLRSAARRGGRTPPGRGRVLPHRGARHGRRRPERRGVRGTGRHTEAIEVSLAGLELSVALGDQNQVAWTLLHLGLAYGGAGQFAQGTSALTRALDHQRLIGDTAGQVTLLHHLASARTAAGEGLTLAQGIGDPDLLNGVRATLADIGRQPGLRPPSRA
ncbi:hypothetical protein [Herbidospora cretacea]|uniref:hypothetical protein n=1 Tax=Herbidospora cretacea TaxID=28444 RepID=UPI0004C42AC7|nr:hypothetical protein [Herbidospora cretacea]